MSGSRIRAALATLPGINKTISIQKQQHPTTPTTTPATTTGCNSSTVTTTITTNNSRNEELATVTRVIMAMDTSVQMVTQDHQEHLLRQMMAPTKHLVIT